jgi:hypothetical protein
MKYVIPVLALTILFAACKSGTENQKSEAEEIAARMLPIVHGTWVMTDYITSLEQTKSPLESSKLLTGVVALDFDTTGRTGDSVSVQAKKNNHENILFSIYFRKGQTETSVPVSFVSGNEHYELDYSVANNDTTLLLCRYSADNKLLDKRSFIKWKTPVADYDDPSAVQRFANKVLFTGKYMSIDENGKTDEWELSDGGVAIGVDGHGTYFVFTDFFEEEAGYLVDEMCFDEHEKSQKPYIFSIKGDTTFLYQAKENEERTKIEKGPLKYTLVKQ